MVSGIIIQARMTSTRLPGKVLKTIRGRPLLWYVICRLRSTRGMNRTVIATTTDAEDDSIVAWCESEGVDVFRGSREDVLDRYFQAANRYGIDPVVRVTADCPLIDRSVVERVIDRFARGDVDHVGNGIPPTFPDGLDCEIFSAAALATAWREASLTSEREHVSPFIYKRPERFSLASIVADRDYSSYRLTVDEPEDFALVTAIIEHFGEHIVDTGMVDILAWLDANPAVLGLNRRFQRNEGYEKSLREDREIGPRSCS